MGNEVMYKMGYAQSTICVKVMRKLPHRMVRQNEDVTKQAFQYIT